MKKYTKQIYIKNKPVLKKKYQNERVKSACFSCLFKAEFSHLVGIASFNISCSLFGAQSTMEKQFLLAKRRHARDCCKC